MGSRAIGRATAIGFAVGALLIALPAPAQQPPNPGCQNQGNAVAPDLAIRACTAEIAAAFNKRGNAYRAKGDLERAIADYDEAIRLDPGDASAFVNRGLAYAAKRDFDQAIANCSEA